MILHAPFMISSRLMAAVKVGEATLSIGFGTFNAEHRMQYDIWIDLPDGTEHHVTDMQSGRGGGSMQRGMADLLSFLAAAAESRNNRDEADKPDEDSNEGLFVPAVVEWAAANSDEIESLGCEIEETKNLGGGLK